MPAYESLRRMMLPTRDANGLHAQYGFNPLAAPDRMMGLRRPDGHARQP